jgi:hypothetical protein
MEFIQNLNSSIGSDEFCTCPEKIHSVRDFCKFCKAAQDAETRKTLRSDDAPLMLFLCGIYGTNPAEIRQRVNRETVGH